MHACLLSRLALKGMVVTLMSIIIGWVKNTPFFECVGDNGNRGIMEASDSFLDDHIHIVNWHHIGYKLIFITYK